MTDRTEEALEGKDDHLITEKEYREMFGGISAMTSWRWDRDPRIPTPPRIRVRSRVYRSFKKSRRLADELARNSVPSAA